MSSKQYETSSECAQLLLWIRDACLQSVEPLPNVANIVMPSNVQIEIVGLIKEHNFHIAKNVAEELKLKYPDAFLDPKIQPLFESDWHVYLYNKKRELQGEVWQFSSNLMCFLNGQLLGDEKDLASWAEKQWQFTGHIRPHAFYEELTGDYYVKHLHKTRTSEDGKVRTQIVIGQNGMMYDVKSTPHFTKHQFVFMDIEIQGEPVGRLLFELFSDVCPKTCKNFQALCTGECDLSQSGLMLCYKGSVFHRVVPSGWVQGGDVSPEGKGNRGESIYGPIFEDESFAVSHTKRGILGMANQGRHSNGSQFYITLQPSLWMDTKYVAFGQVVEGTDVLKRLEGVPTYNERPKEECKIADCGAFAP